MKNNFIFSMFLLVASTIQLTAQELPVSTTTIQKVGQTELKASVMQPKTRKFGKDKSAINYKKLWNQHTNGTTEIEFNKDVTVNNIKIKAGKYLLLLFPGNDWKPTNDALYAFPGNDWKPKNDSILAFPGNDWKPKDSITKFPGNDWKPKNDTINVFPGNDWKPNNDSLIAFPGNDWNPKNSKVKFPGNDWKPKKSKIKFPGNDWKPVNDLMESFPGNDWLVVFYHNIDNNSIKFDKSLIAAETTVDSKRLLVPSANLSANFIYLNPESVQLTVSWDKTLLSIPINIR